MVDDAVEVYQQECQCAGTHAVQKGKSDRTGDACRAREGTHACPARLPHRLLRRHCCWGLLVRIEKLLGDLERAELAVPSEDSVVLGVIEAVSPGWKEMCRDGRVCGRRLRVDLGRVRQGLEVGRYGWGGVGHRVTRAASVCACSASLLTGFFATTSLKSRS